MDIKRLHDDDLARLWRVSLSTIEKWRRKKWLVPDSHTVEGWYDPSTVDAYHRAGIDKKKAHQADLLPDTLTLLTYEAETGKPALLLASEVMDIRGITPDVLYRSTQAGKIIGFKTPGGGKLLFPATLVIPPEPKPLITGVSLQTASDILGLSYGVTASLLDTDPPELTDIGHDESIDAVTSESDELARIVISDMSLDAYLERHLQKDYRGKPFLTATRWRALRAAFGYDELLTTQAIKHEFHVHGRAIRAAITDGTLPCLRTVGGHARVPRRSVEQWHTTRNR